MTAKTTVKTTAKETKPAAAQETKPATQEIKPATQEIKPATPTQQPGEQPGEQPPQDSALAAPTPNQPSPQAKPLSVMELAYWRATRWATFKGGYLARASHELRSPLSSMMGLQQLILEDLCDSPEEERDCVQRSYDTAQKLLRLLEQVVLVSKLEMGPPNLMLQPVDVDLLLGELEMVMSMPMADRNIAFKVELPTGSPANGPADDLVAWGDPKGLKEALLAILDSAIDLKSTKVRVQATLEPGDSAKDQTGAVGPNAIGLSAIGSSAIGSSAVVITVEDDRSTEGWREDLKGLQETPPQIPSLDPAAPENPYRLSPSFALWVAQELIGAMGGTLTLMQVPGSDQDAPAESGQDSDQPKAIGLSRIVLRLPTPKL